MKTKQIAVLGMLAAISIVGVCLIHFPIFPAVSFLEYDPADIPILIATFAFGPVSGLLLTAVVSVVQGVTVSAHSGIVGIIMHILATGVFVATSGFIYKGNKTRKRAYLALAFGVLAMTATMTLWNIIVTPIYMGVPRGAVMDLLGFIVAFNFIKAFFNALITAVIYKGVHKVISKFVN